jgi:hypothetical protein
MIFWLAFSANYRGPLVKVFDSLLFQLMSLNKSGFYDRHKDACLKEFARIHTEVVAYWCKNFSMLADTWLATGVGEDYKTYCEKKRHYLFSRYNLIL